MDKFTAEETALEKGITLIEASAGTGKTYAIAMLVLRFVVEQQVDIKRILVVTFTKAATEELKERIRARLVEARQIVVDLINRDDSSQQQEKIDHISQWLVSLELDNQAILQRLNNALLDIDQAGIFTIHGFCQRILTEHALESGQLFDSELTGDISTIKQACSDDFWRKTIYTRSAWEAALLTADYQTPDQLLASVDYISPDSCIIPNVEQIDQKLTDLKQLVITHKQSVTKSLALIKEKLSEEKFKKNFERDFQSIQQNLLDWLNEKSVDKPDFSPFTKQGLTERLNGVKFKSSQTRSQSSDEQKQCYIKSLGIQFKPFEQLDSAIKNTPIILRRSLLETLHAELDDHLQQLNLLSYDNLITRLVDALQSEKGASLCQEIRQQYKVALVDEFQDTDQNQWFIFSTLFHSDAHTLYLIGDPKQAIYKFRGADIQSYFSAKKQAQQQYSLGFNWRSNPQLVEGVNTLFKVENPFLSNHLDFMPVSAALTSDEGALVKNNQLLAPLVLWQLEENEKDKEGFWKIGDASSEIITAVVNEILDLLTADYAIQSKEKKPVQPADIAILVKKNAQAKVFQSALNDAGITAVINSKESVFSAPDAVNLLLLLKSLSRPTDNALLKQALTLDWFNLNGQQLWQTFQDELQMDSWFSRFQDYQQQWQKKGLMAMMQQLLANENILPQLAGHKQAERRITNLLHCIELVQQAVIDHHLGINKTLDWLHNNIVQAELGNTASDEQQLRLESDEDAVQIITMHGAKGLEYPIVFCPFLWQRSDQLKKEKIIIKYQQNNKRMVDLGSDQFEQHRSLALEEELAEDIRLFYVAVTRAKYRCYINWADVRSKNKANDSAMAHLMAFAIDDFSQQQKKLKQYAKKQPSVFQYRLFESGQPIATYRHTQASELKLAYKQRKRSSLHSHWQMSSYTALSSLSIQNVPELPDDKAREESIAEVTEKIVYLLPRGAHTGNVIHDLLENIPFKQLAEKTNISLQRDRSCLRYGLKIDQPELIDQLLASTVNTTLNTENDRFKLKDLQEEQCLKEMPFYLSMNTMDVSSINQVLQDCPAYQPLSKKQMCGFLTGFIDLICEYRGKFYIMDYKSNGLETYEQPELIKAMREHNYGLQYWIYSLVLVKYLQHRLPDYRYEKHFGGVMYLFVRGMSEDDGNSGVYWDKPEQLKIEQLAKLFI